MHGGRNAEAPICRRLRVTGVVQGVNYRVSCARMARSLGVVGWVRNAGDGSVEVVAQGPGPAVGRLIEWCRRGPAAASVEGVEIADESVDVSRRTFDVVA